MDHGARHRRRCGCSPESVDGDQLAAAYQSSDLFVLPTYWFEGFPTAITEAMDRETPIITTRTRGIGDHLDAGVNALFISLSVAGRVG